VNVRAPLPALIRAVNAHRFTAHRKKPHRMYAQPPAAAAP
jgi:hypothetical protein